MSETRNTSTQQEKTEQHQATSDSSAKQDIQKKQDFQEKHVERKASNFWMWTTFAVLLLLLLGAGFMIIKGRVPFLKNF